MCSIQFKSVTDNSKGIPYNQCFTRAQMFCKILHIILHYPPGYVLMEDTDRVINTCIRQSLALSIENKAMSFKHP